MNHSNLPLLSLFVGIQFILSCDSDDEKKIVCRPATVKFPAYTEEYVYNTAHKVETILYRVPNSGTRTGDLTYTDKGLLTKLTLFDFSSPPKAYNTYKLVYDGQEKPQQLYYLPVDPSEEPVLVSTFVHDEKQRLVKVQGRTIGAVQISRRYEYDDNDNVVKVFKIFGTDEVLYAENLSFDDKPRVFSTVSKLQTLRVYMEGYDPSKNNVLTAIIHDDVPGYPKNTPQAVSYVVDYDENGLITSCQAPSYFVMGPLYVDEVTYKCE